MATEPVPSPQPEPSAPPAKAPGIPFGVNELRLNGRHWGAVLGILALVLFITPRLWKRLEAFDTAPDYRLPYSLSQDYWLYERRLERDLSPGRIVLLGDSVVWGEYVLPDGTLSHFLNRDAGTPERFVNAGVNGLFPLALEGLATWYGGPLRHRKILLHCNVLWMTSPKVDLQTSKEEKFNHASLVPQFFPRIPCYKADASTRLGIQVERSLGFVSWINHLQHAWFGGKSLLNWTLQDDGSDPPQYPNAWKNPLAQVAFRVPVAPAEDPQRGPRSPRHKPWFQGSGPARFDWVSLESSLQWRAFQRLVKNLREHGNECLVVVGPFNEHLVAAESRPGFQRLQDGITRWLAENQVAFTAPEALPSELYADASHPLTQGYELLAKKLAQTPAFQSWLARP